MFFKNSFGGIDAEKKITRSWKISFCLLGSRWRTPTKRLLEMVCRVTREATRRKWIVNQIMQSLALLRKARQKSETLRWGRLQVAIRRRTNIEPTARDRSDYERSKRAKTKGMPPILSDLSQVKLFYFFRTEFLIFFFGEVFLYCLYTSTFTKIERRLNSTTCVYVTAFPSSIVSQSRKSKDAIVIWFDHHFFLSLKVTHPF